MKTRDQTIWQELELGFGGGSKFRVFLHLALNNNMAFTKYALVKATGLRTPSVDGQLKTLLRLRWIKEYLFNPVTYQIDNKNDTVRLILEFLKKAKDLGRNLNREEIFFQS